MSKISCLVTIFQGPARALLADLSGYTLPLKKKGKNKKDDNNKIII